LRTQNMMTPGGNIETGPQSWTWRSDGRVKSVDQVRGIVVRADQGRILRLAHVANVADGEEAIESLARYDGKDAVLLTVVKQSGRNTIQVVDKVLARVKGLQKTLPPGVELSIIRDNSQ